MGTREKSSTENAKKVSDEHKSKKVYRRAEASATLEEAVATAKSFESDKDKNGNTVAGSLKKKIHDYVASLSLSLAQKYMLMGYLGYKNTLGGDKVKAYIQTLKLSAEQKKVLLKESGY